MFILYIKKKYQVFKTSVDKQTKKGIKRSENVYKLYQLIDIYGINNLIYGKLQFLYPESETILYVNYI
jgi:hypothetical protein